MSFNPLPPPKRGEIPVHARGLRGALPVSIRSPPPKRGEIVSKACHENVLIVSIRSPRRSEGRYGHPHGDVGIHGVSIRSPRRSEGRSDSTAEPVLACEVSIRSPRRSEGRCRFPASLAHTRHWFQSAPPAEARGDVRRKSQPVLPPCFNPLPPPKRGEIR